MGDGEELRLVLLAQCEDRGAIEALLLRVQHPLLRYIEGLVGGNDAQDVLQDVFVRLWRNLKWLRDAELFRPWAYRIASRAAFEHLKRERRWSDKRDDETAVEELPGAEADAPEFLGGLEPMLDRMSPASRAVLLLHYREDLPIDDVAAILGIEVGTAKSRLAYGLSSLRKHMKGKGK